MLFQKNKDSKNSRGQAMAEFALTIPVFLLLIFGVIELSRYFLVYSSIFTATREATRYGSSVGDESLPNYQNCEMIAETAVRMGNFGGVQSNDISIYYETEPGTWVADCDPAVENSKRYKPKLGDRIVVEISTDFDSMLDIVPDMTVNASNGRTIMLGVINQGSVIVTEDSDDESTPVPTQAPTEAPTEAPTSTPVSGQTETPSPEPTNTPSFTPETPEIICVEPDISLDRVEYKNSNNEVIVYIKNNSSENYKVNNFRNLKWGKSDLEIDFIKWDTKQFYNTNTFPEVVNVPLPTDYSLELNKNSTLPITFKFMKNSNNLSISFNLIFYRLDNNCPTQPKEFKK